MEPVQGRRIGGGPVVVEGWHVLQRNAQAQCGAFGIAGPADGGSSNPAVEASLRCRRAVPLSCRMRGHA
jgi:hypothetical protein